MLAALPTTRDEDWRYADPQALAALMPDAKALDIAGRDHMLAVGDRVFKAAVKILAALFAQRLQAVQLIQCRAVDKGFEA